MRLLSLLILVGGLARADSEPSQRKWHLGIEAMTDFPLYTGAQVWVELPHRIRLSTSFGEMPDAYVDTINAVAVAAGLYGHRTANLIEEFLDHAFTWRLHAGWRPLPRHGGYIEVGVGILEVHGNLGITSVLEAATGIMAPNEVNVGFGFKLDSVVETFGVEAGWMWMPWRDLTVRFALGFAGAVGAQVDLRPNFTTSSQFVFTRLVSNYTEQLIEKYLMIPTIGLAIGWRVY
jgi:hypothetical protein